MKMKMSKQEVLREPKEYMSKLDGRNFNSLIIEKISLKSGSLKIVPFVAKNTDGSGVSYIIFERCDNADKIYRIAYDIDSRGIIRTINVRRSNEVRMLQKVLDRLSTHWEEDGGPVGLQRILLQICIGRKANKDTYELINHITHDQRFIWYCRYNMQTYYDKSEASHVIELYSKVADITSKIELIIDKNDIITWVNIYW